MAGETVQEGGAFARLLIILYAAGIIALGIQPFKRGYGSFFAELSRSYERVVESFSSPPPLKSKMGGSALPGGASSAKSLDGITKEDRKRLQSLIDGL